ncbi:NADPH-dependent FMN reductase [Nocardia aurantia]|uniref:Quinone reductase n=1 Tax=Nocardia aurantia TaxID=2585199 RepID=A0A7K0E337_9NOCA|nr:NAD(P)H-dependent oxidoreductase [Nocardia aurantia]MQY31564.1 Quinone reductase [Nocardia aurantia]
MTTIGIIIGSTRPGRNGEGVARWVRELAVAHAGDAADFELVDLLDYRLPLLDEPIPAARADGTQPHTRHWAERIAACDAFVIVTPEYNTTAPSSLTNAIDYLLREWAGKPVGYVGYGIYGAVMAIHKLRAQAGVLRMADIGPQVALTLAEDFVNFSEFRPREFQAGRLRELLDELLAWERALVSLRTEAGAAS